MAAAPGRTHPRGAERATWKLQRLRCVLEAPAPPWPVRDFLLPNRPQHQTGCMPVPQSRSLPRRAHGKPAAFSHSQAGGSEHRCLRQALCWKGEGHGCFHHHRQLLAPVFGGSSLPSTLQDAVCHGGHRSHQGATVGAGDSRSEGCCPHRHICHRARLRMQLWHGPRTRCPSVRPSRPVMLPKAQAAAPHQPVREAALVSLGQAGMLLIAGPALPRSPAGGEARVHLPWLGERTKEGICGRGSAAAGCAAARLIRPVPPRGPGTAAAAMPSAPCSGRPRHRQHRGKGLPETRGSVWSWGGAQPGPPCGAAAPAAALVCAPPIPPRAPVSQGCSPRLMPHHKGKVLH